jgi:citrate lyase beta subunit
MPASPLLDEEFTQDVLARLGIANQEFERIYPGDSVQRQPVHVVYGGADRFKSDTIRKLAKLAETAFLQAAPDAVALGKLLDLPDTALLETVHARVLEKLKREAVEDFRIDFEDGFGSRTDDEEDAFALQSAKALAEAMREGLTPPFIGLRIKSLSEECKHRSVRTLSLFMETLLTETGGQLSANFVVTLPKITAREQVMALSALLRHLEERAGLPVGAILVELMMEAPQLLSDSQGHCLLPELVRVAQGRCRGMHFGPYDYLSACNITASSQYLAHPACDFARGSMQVALAGTGVWLSDGPTNLMPIAPHRGEANTLTAAQLKENQAAIQSAWRLNYRHIRHALERGFYQGWDLHPAQFPIRYVALYLFFLEGFGAAAGRLRNFMAQSAQATTQATGASNMFDDAATGQGLLNYFLRALSCGALTESEVSSTGLTLDEIRSRSFGKIMENRRVNI